jgi:hypothetical protein
VTLKVLRLVLRHCANLVTKKLFTTIFVYLLNDRWAALNNIANSPNVAGFVKKIELCNGPIVDRCHSFEEWYAHNKRKEGLLRRPAESLPQGVGSTLATNYNTSRTCEEAFRLYRSWLSDEFDMVSLGSMPLSFSCGASHTSRSWRRSTTVASSKFAGISTTLSCPTPCVPAES